jgi:hypothetical protein
MAAASTPGRTPTSRRARRPLPAAPRPSAAEPAGRAQPHGDAVPSPRARTPTPHPEAAGAANGSDLRHDLVSGATTRLDGAFQEALEVG